MRLVVAGDNRHLAAMGKPDLGASQDMPGRMKRDGHRPVFHRVAELQRLEAAGAVRPVAPLHDLDGLRRRQHMVVAGARMVGMAMRDDRTFDRPHRVDIGVDRLYIELMVQPLHDEQYRQPPPRLQSHPLTGWLDARGWRWFDHQIEAAEHALERRDVIVFAPTGAGKTLAGFLPSFLDIHDRARPAACTRSISRR